MHHRTRWEVLPERPQIPLNTIGVEGGQMSSVAFHETTDVPVGIE